jgi:hypothetical protein
MTNWIKKNKSSIIRIMFIIPIILVAAISISHVVSWYDLANPISWAIYLSIAVEVAAMTALSAASVRVKGFSVWMVFGIVTFIQFMGNIFFSYKEINVNDENFKSWVELVTPIFDMMGLDSSDPINHKRWLALLTGGLLPLISLTCLHFFIKYGGADESETNKEILESKTPEEYYKVEDSNEVVENNTYKEEELIPYEEIGSESEGVFFNVENSLTPDEEVKESVVDNNPNIKTEEFSDEEDQKKNDQIESIDDDGGRSIDQGTTNNSKIQLGSSRSGENIIYKQRGLRQ